MDAHAAMRRSLISLLLVLFLGSVSLTPDARAGALRITLLDGAVVRGDSIVLADLLPVDTPRLLRDAAENVNLGRSPQSGLYRRLARSAVLWVLAANGVEASAFVIPEFITVRRATHVVTRGEVLAAIRQALAKSELPNFPSLQPDDVSFDPIALPDQASHLEVTEITYDEFIGRARFRLRVISAPEVHPFYVTAILPFGSTINPSSLRGAVAAHTSSSSSTSPDSPVLLDPGRLARLHLHSSNANIFLDVRPLQRGHLGEIIRVRFPSNGRTFRARVTEGGSLDAVL
jgi:hypothetical protein